MTTWAQECHHRGKHNFEWSFRRPSTEEVDRCPKRRVRSYATVHQPARRGTRCATTAPWLCEESAAQIRLSHHMQPNRLSFLRSGWVPCRRKLMAPCREHRSFHPSHRGPTTWGRWLPCVLVRAHKHRSNECKFVLPRLCRLGAAGLNISPRWLVGG